MYHLGYDQRNEVAGRREIETAKSPAQMMTFSGKDVNAAIDLRSGLPPSGICMYQVPVTVNSDSSTDNTIYSCMWEKPRSPGAEATGKHMVGMSYRDKWEQLRISGSHKDFTIPTRDHSSSTMVDEETQDCGKDMYRTTIRDRTNIFGGHVGSAVDVPQTKSPESLPVSPSRFNIVSPHSRTDVSLEIPKTPCAATPSKISTPIHGKRPANSSQPMWFGDTVLSPASDQESSDLCQRVPFHKQNSNPGQDWSNVEFLSGNFPELSVCQRRSHNRTNCEMRYARDNGLVSNVLLGVLCVVLSAFGLVLLLRLTYRNSEGMQVHSGDSLLTSNSSHTILKDIAVGLSVLVLFLNLWCLLTMALISYLAARLLKCQNGDQRASEFIHQCEVTRVTAAAGAFASIPIFMLALLLYTIIDYSFVSAVICVVILSAGITCTIITIIHSTCTWHQQKCTTIPPQQQGPAPSSSDVRNTHGALQNSAVNYFELSTLV